MTDRLTEGPGVIDDEQSPLAGSQPADPRSKSYGTTLKLPDSVAKFWNSSTHTEKSSLRARANFSLPRLGSMQAN